MPMKKTRLISLLKNIWATKASYLSILVFVALGIGIFLGIKWNQPAFLHTAHRYYEDYELYDFNIKSPFGITDEDIEVLLSTEGVSEAEGGYTAEGMTAIGGKNYVLSIVSTTESMNFATAFAGALPEKPNEIGIERSMAEDIGLELGDSITVNSQGMEVLDQDSLKEKEFTVTAIVEHPAYIRISASRSRGISSIGDGMADYYVLTSPDAFNTKAYDDCYSNTYIRCDSLRGLYSFGDEYNAELDAIAVKLEELGSVRGAERAESVRARVEKELDNAETLVAEGEAALEEAKAKVAEGEKEIAEAEQRIAEAETEIAEGEKALEEAKVQLQEGEAKIAPARNRYYSAKREYDAANKQVSASTGYSIDQLIKMYNSASASTKKSLQRYGDIDAMIRKKQRLDAAGRELRAGENELAAARNQIAEGETQLESGRLELENGKKELASYKLEIEEAKKQIAEGTVELEDGRHNKDTAEDILRRMNAAEAWTLEKRTGNLNYHIAEVYSEISQKLCYSLALLFVFVGVMISYTSIARIVQEQRPLIGVQKSLGFTKREITAQYMVYALSAVLLGGICGATLGYFGIEKIVNGAFEKNHIIGSFIPYFSWADLLAIVLVEMVLIGLAAWLGCRRHLAQTAIRLMQKNTGESSGRTRFYEKWGWWQKSSLYTQTIINNLMNDRTRIIATLVGVVGCTALMVMALGVQASIRNTPAKHFDRIWTYDARLLADDREADCMENLLPVLDEEGVDYTAAYKKLYFIEDEWGSWINGDILVPGSEDDFADFIHLYGEKGETLSLPEEGVLINETYTRYHNILPGDEITVMGMDGDRYFLVVAGITEHYLSANQLVMSADYYEKVLGSEPENNTAFIKLGDMSFDELESRLAGEDGFMALRNDRGDWAATFESHQATTMLMVSIALLLAVIMALMVLLNLNVVLINEKALELTVMRINGYSVAAAKAYIYRDNIVLTVLGIMLGVGAGLLLSNYVITSLSSESMSLITDADLKACLMGAGTSAVFALITNIIALRRVNKLKVSDISKL